MEEEKLEIATGSTDVADGRGKVIMRHVKEWVNQSDIIDASLAQMAEQDREVYEYIRNVFSNPAPDMEQLLANQATLQQLGLEYQGKLGTALKTFASKVRFIVSDFDIFRELSEQIRADKVSRGLDGASGASAVRSLGGGEGEENGGFFRGVVDQFKKNLDFVSQRVRRATGAGGAVQKEQRRVELEDGTVFEGWFLGDKMVDRGRIDYPDGTFYEGDWNENGPHGFGTFHGSSFTETGQYVDGERSGNGRIEYEDGSYYEGEWNDNGMHGQASYHDGDFAQTGMFRDGEPFGSGRIDYSDGSWYEGGWNAEGKHGRGIYYDTETNKRFIGTFRDDAMVDKGRIEWEDGSWYEGGWNDKGANGTGVSMNKKYKRKDTGTFKDGNRVGYGKMEWIETGESYEGGWDAVGFCGKGVLRWNDRVFDGEFSDGGAGAGKGVISYGSGNRYEGEWFDYKPHGNGKYYEKDFDRTFHTTFKNGIIGSEGTIVMGDGTVYEGKWKIAENLEIIRFDGVIKKPDGFEYEGTTLNGINPSGTKCRVRFTENGDNVEIKGEIIEGDYKYGSPCYLGEKRYYSNGVCYRKELGCLRLKDMAPAGVIWKGKDEDTCKKLNIASWCMLAVSLAGMWFYHGESITLTLLLVLGLVAGYVNQNRRPLVTKVFFYLPFLMYLVTGIMGWISFGSYFTGWIFLIVALVCYLCRNTYVNNRADF